MHALPKITVMGAGAVGCYFGGLLALAGAPVHLIGREYHVKAIRNRGLLIESDGERQCVNLPASVGVDSIREADIVLFCVKTTGIERAGRSIASALKPSALLVSMQNGVDNIDRIRAATGRAAIASAVWASTAMIGAGHVVRSGETELVFGLPKDQDCLLAKTSLEKLIDLFHRAGVPCRSSDDIEGSLWLKLLWNCASNAVTALGNASYTQVVRSALSRRTMLAAALEVEAVARRAEVNIPNLELTEDMVGTTLDLGDITSSTAQDIQQGRTTEIDSLNGYVSRRGRELGVPTPVNDTLYTLVKLLEQNSLRSSEKHLGSINA